MQPRASSPRSYSHIFSYPRFWSTTTIQQGPYCAECGPFQSFPPPSAEGSESAARSMPQPAAVRFTTIAQETTARLKLNPWGLLKLWKLNGSFSAVSKPIFASKYSLESSWRDLQDLHSFAPLRPQQFSKISSQSLAIFSQMSSKIRWKSMKF